MKNKYINSYSQFRNNKLNEELSIGDIFSNLFKSKEKKQLEVSIKEWDALNRKFIEIFSKNDKWKEYLSKFGYFDGVTDNLYKYWKEFITSDVPLYPFKVMGKDYKELSIEEITVLKKIIESVFEMYNKFNTTVETIKTSSDSLFQKWGELSKEFGEDLDQVGDSKELKGNIENKVDFIKSVLEGLSEGSIPRIKEEKEIELFEKIFDLNFEDYRMGENKKINFLKLFLYVSDTFNKESVIENIKNSLGFIGKLKKMKERFIQLGIEKLVNPLGSDYKIPVMNDYESLSTMCKNLGINPNKFQDNKDLFDKIKRAVGSLSLSEFNYDKSMQTIFDLCEKTLGKDEFLKKITISTGGIIEKNGLTDKDIYFTHSSSIKDLGVDTIKFDYDEGIRGARSENTPKDIYGFYLTDWKSEEDQDYDAWHYIYRAGQATGIFSPKGINLYVIKLKDDSRFLKSYKSQFRQTNESTKEFADYCKSIGLSGYYHPNVYHDKSALEIVLIDKGCIESMKKDEESKMKIIEAEKGGD
jgi:hypothetical protein